MPCPCANPPGSSKIVVPRNPYTLKPLNGNALSRDAIRTGKVKQVVAEEESDDTEKVAVRQIYRGKRPMGGFLGSDVFRKK